MWQHAIASTCQQCPRDHVGVLAVTSRPVWMYVWNCGFPGHVPPRSGARHFSVLTPTRAVNRRKRNDSRARWIDSPCPPASRGVRAAWRPLPVHFTRGARATRVPLVWLRSRAVSPMPCDGTPADLRGSALCLAARAPAARSGGYYSDPGADRQTGRIDPARFNGSRTARPKRRNPPCPCEPPPARLLGSQDKCRTKRGSDREGVSVCVSGVDLHYICMVAINGLASSLQHCALRSSAEND
ncbi:hypothetical protein SEVIR_1G261950v4 [Setaria viridis]